MKTLIISKLHKEILKKRNVPNYKLVNDLVYYVHRYLCIHELPINLDFMYNFDDLKIETYSWFANLNKISIYEVIQITNSDSGCCYYDATNNRYLILYNDLIENPCHNRWTLAHELGHYLLKHNEICNTAILGRNSLDLEEYRIYEKEANAFAKELLAPLNVICTILDNFSIIDIMNLCNLSYEASSYIFEYIVNGIKMGISYDCESKTTKLFKKFIDNHKYLNSCTNCSYSFTSLNASFCPICGCNTLIKGGLKNKMKYNCSYNLDSNSRITECPICHNEEITDGEYCKICGTYLINKCTNYIEDEWGNQIEGCGKLAEANARYCIYCGGETTFYRNNLLCNFNEYDIKQEGINNLWKEILENIKSNGKIVLYTNLLNTQLIEVDDETLCIKFKDMTNFSKVVLSKEENIEELKKFLKDKYKKDIYIQIFNNKNNEYIYKDIQLPF